MNFKKISREEKEKLFIREETRLQIIWGNPLDSDWDFVKKWSDKELEDAIDSTVSQIKFEKRFSWIWAIIKIVVIGLVFLGVIGLLFFGIKQLLYFFA